MYEIMFRIWEPQVVYGWLYGIIMQAHGLQYCEHIHKVYALRLDRGVKRESKGL